MAVNQNALTLEPSSGQLIHTLNSSATASHSVSAVGGADTAEFQIPEMGLWRITMRATGESVPRNIRINMGATGVTTSTTSPFQVATPGADGWLNAASADQHKSTFFDCLFNVNEQDPTKRFITMNWGGAAGITVTWYICKVNN